MTCKLMQEHKQNIYVCASRVEAAIDDRTYKLLTKTKEGPREREVNALVDDQAPSESEARVEHKGKPQSIT